MRLLCCFLLLVLSGFYNSVNAQIKIDLRVPNVCQNSENRIEWSAQRLLDWDDFMGSCKDEHPAIAAITSSIIQYKYHCQNGLLICNVKAIFNKDASCVKSFAKDDDYLAHEQLHFDITELFARKLNNHLNYFEYSCDQESELEDIINGFLSDWRKCQHDYDKETYYSHDTEKQNEWTHFVQQMMMAYESYP